MGEWWQYIVELLSKSVIDELLAILGAIGSTWVFLWRWIKSTRRYYRRTVLKLYKRCLARTCQEYGFDAALLIEVLRKPEVKAILYSDTMTPQDEIRSLQNWLNARLPDDTNQQMPPIRTRYTCCIFSPLCGLILFIIKTLPPRRGSFKPKFSTLSGEEFPRCLVS